MYGSNDIIRISFNIDTTTTGNEVVFVQYQQILNCSIVFKIQLSEGSFSTSVMETKKETGISSREPIISVSLVNLTDSDSEINYVSFPCKLTFTEKLSFFLSLFIQAFTQLYLLICSS